MSFQILRLTSLPKLLTIINRCERDFFRVSESRRSKEELINMTRVPIIIPLMGASLLCWGGKLKGQSVDPNRLESVRTQLAQTKSVLDKVPTSQRGALSSGAQNLLQMANKLDQAGQDFGDTSMMVAARSRMPSASTVIPDATTILVPVSNPSADFLFSMMAGFTQSETTTSWCGANVVVGFNDSGSIFESLVFGAGGVSGSGVAFSTNKGLSFRDVGFVNPGPNPLNFLGGDPVVNCANSNVFYYTQIFQTGTLSPFQISAAVAVSKSTDGGASWADPIAAVSKDGFTHFLDKPWSTLDPTDPNRLFVTYTDFDFSGAVCGFVVPGFANPRIAIELVRSSNGGATWDAPVVVDEECSAPPNFAFVQGSQVVVDSHANVFVAWEAYPSGSFTPLRELRIAQSSNQGASFSKSVKVDNVTPVGDGGDLLQGVIRSSEFPSLAVDRSGGVTDGYLYLTWNDGRNFGVRDLEAVTGTYHYADILISRSIDGGKTWSPAVRVNDDPIALPNGRGTDQFQPGAAIDNTGAVGLCWYDRRADPFNFLIGRLCGISNDAGATWTSIPVNVPSWQPFHAMDLFINPTYLGDYDVVASDFTKASSGFLGAYGNVTARGVPAPNQDVFLVRFP